MLCQSIVSKLSFNMFQYQLQSIAQFHRYRSFPFFIHIFYIFSIFKNETNQSIVPKYHTAIPSLRSSTTSNRCCCCSNWLPIPCIRPLTRLCWSFIFPPIVICFLLEKQCYRLKAIFYE